MIKIDKVQVFGFEGAIRGMRNPYESWFKADSITCQTNPYTGYCNKDKCKFYPCYSPENNCFYPDTPFIIGEADMKLAKKLIKAGPEHRKFLRMIHVQADVVAPRYFWQEADCYKWITKNSSSTMHLITKRLLTLEDFSIDGIEDILTTDAVEDSENILAILNKYISQYQVYDKRAKNDKDKKKKAIFRRIKQLLPESYNQLRTIDTNYEALLSIYHQRKNHRLIEWKDFSTWIESLPYMSEFLEALE